MRYPLSKEAKVISLLTCQLVNLSTKLKLQSNVSHDIKASHRHVGHGSVALSTVIPAIPCIAVSGIVAIEDVVKVETQLHVLDASSLCYVALEAQVQVALRVTGQ